MSSKERELVCQYRALAADPENRPYIVSQGCLPGLVLFLGNTEDAIVTIALEALDYITQYKAHRSRMAKEPGLAAGLRKLMLHSNSKVKAMAIQVYGNIQDHFNEKEPVKEVIVNRQEKTESDPLTSMFSENVATKISSARTFHFYIKGLTTDELKQQIEGVLLGIKGVISYLVDIYAGKAVIRTLTSVDALTLEFKKAGITVSGVEEQGDGKGTKPAAAPKEDPNKENKANQNNGGWWNALVSTSDSGTWWGSGRNYGKKNTPPNNGQQQQAGVLGKLGKALWG